MQNKLEPSLVIFIEGIPFFRIALKLGIIDKERREFWRFLKNAVFVHRNRFAQAIRLAAMVYHFPK